MSRYFNKTSKGKDNISFKEAMALMENTNITISRGQMKVLMDMFDYNKDDKLSFQEFVDMVRKMR